MATTTINHGVDFVLDGEQLAAFNLIPQADAIGEIYAGFRCTRDKLSSAFQKIVAAEGYAVAIADYGDSLATADHRVSVCELAILKAAELLRSGEYPSGVVVKLSDWLADFLYRTASQSGGSLEDRSRRLQAICDLKTCFDRLPRDSRYVGRNSI